MAPANKNPPNAGDQPTVQQVSDALEWVLNTQARQRRDADEAVEVPRLGLIEAVAAELAVDGSDPDDLEILQTTTIRVLEARLDRLSNADRTVAEILLVVHRLLPRLGYQSRDRTTRDVIDHAPIGCVLIDVAIGDR